MKKDNSLYVAAFDTSIVLATFILVTSSNALQQMAKSRVGNFVNVLGELVEQPPHWKTKILKNSREGGLYEMETRGIFF